MVTNNLRISGLASGMDTEKMIADLMKAQRIPLDRLKQKKQVLEWQRDGYREMNTLLLNLRSTASKMKLSSGFHTKTTTSSDDTRVSATASTSAGNTTYSITQVDRLASAATKVSGTISANSTAKIDANKALYLSNANLGSQITWKQGSVESTTLAVASDGTAQINLAGASLKADPLDATRPDVSEMVIKVNGTAFEVINSGTPTANQVLVDSSGKLTFGTTAAAGSSGSVNFIADTKIESFKTPDVTKDIQLKKSSIVEANFSLTFGTTTYTSSGGKLYSGSTEVGTIDQATGHITLNTGYEIPKDTDVTIEYAQNYFTFDMSSYTSNSTPNPVTEKFAVQGSESLNKVLSRISSSSLGISAMYDSFSDQVSLTRTETGDFNSVGNEMVTTDGFFSNVLKFASSTETGGVNAKFTINGLSTERTSNTFDMNGVSITLKKAFTSSESTVTLSVNNNAEDIVDKVKKFVETYNDALSKILGKVNEPYYRNYQPLTDDQREQLSDNQEEQWEEKSKSGLLRNDSLLRGILDKMRIDISTPVNGDGMNYKYTQISSIGITSTANYLEGGKLEIDEKKLRDALADDPTSVEKLFTTLGNTNSTNGIADRLYDSIDAAMNQIKVKAGSTYSTNETFSIGKNLNRINSDILTFEDRLKQTEDRYWRQFSAMEEAINRSNSQSASLMSLFNQG
jgi:flagellar hook-associated protein 2